MNIEHVIHYINNSFFSHIQLCTRKCLLKENETQQMTMHHIHVLGIFIRIYSSQMEQVET